MAKKRSEVRKDRKQKKKDDDHKNKILRRRNAIRNQTKLQNEVDLLKQSMEPKLIPIKKNETKT